MSTALLEELAEDAFVAYLGAKCSGDIAMYAAFSTEKNRYPCAVVHFGESEGVANSTYHNARLMSGAIGVMTEAADLLQGGKVVKTARERNAEVRGDVMNALAILDTATAPAGLSALCQSEDMPHGLAAELDVMQIPGIWFCQATMGKVTRTVEGDNKKLFVSTIEIAVIAQPVAIGGEPT